MPTKHAMHNQYQFIVSNKNIGDDIIDRHVSIKTCEGRYAKA